MMNFIFNPQNYFFNKFALPHLLVGVLVALEGIYVFSQSRKTITHIAFLIFALTAGTWLTGVGIGCLSCNETTSWLWYRHVSWFGIIFVTPAVYLFSTTWDPFLLKAKKNQIIVNYLTGLCFYLICISTRWLTSGLWRFKTGFFPKAGFLEGVFIVWFYAVMALSFANFVKLYRREEIPTRKKNIKWMFTAFVIGFFGSVEYFPNYGIPVFPAAFLPMLIFTSIMGYCVVRYKLMDIETVIHKTIMWLVSSAILVAPFYFVIYKITVYTQHFGKLENTLLVIAEMFVFYFYYRTLHPRIDDLFQRRQRNLQNVLTDFSKELVHLKSLRDLLQGFARLMRRTFYTRRISVYLLHKNGQEFYPAIVKRVRGLEPVPVTNPFIKWLEVRDMVAVAEFAESDPAVESFKESVKNYFETMEAVVVVPFVLGGKLIGFANLGKKETLRRYHPQEIRFLNLLKSPVTIAFSNSLQVIAMQEKLQEWNEELERKVVERTAQLEDTQAQLVQAEKLATVGTFAGGIAHEINNPLTAVLTNAQILKMDAKNEEDIETLSLIEEGAKRCQVIIQKLLKYTRQPGKEPEHKSMDLAQVIQNAISILKYQMMQENVEIIFAPTATDYLMKGIPNELEQVFTNMMLNARDAIRDSKRKGRIEITLSKTQDRLVAAVKDNGVGIKKETLGKIFDPFFTTKQVGAGTGLGLAVSHSILEKHGCRPVVESEVGVGTTFILEFPREPASGLPGGRDV